jgi:hypothetical protein
MERFGLLNAHCLIFVVRDDGSRLVWILHRPEISAKVLTDVTTLSSPLKLEIVRVLLPHIRHLQRARHALAQAMGQEG